MIQSGALSSLIGRGPLCCYPSFLCLERTSSRHPKPPTQGISCLSLFLNDIMIVGGFYALKGSIIVDGVSKM